MAVARWRRSAVAALAVLSLASLAACGGNSGGNDNNNTTNSGSPGAPVTQKMLVYGAFATPIEEPWDGVIHAALQQAAATGDITYKYVDNIGYSGGMERTLRNIAQTEHPAVIFGDAFGNEDAVRTVAKDFPDIAFVFGSGEKEQAPNMAVFDNWIHDPAYLAGMLAGGVTKSNVLGVVGGYPVPEVNRIVNGFIAGAQSVNHQVTVKVSFINSWFDPAKAKQAALAQVSSGADVLFAERAGVIAAAKEKGLRSIGCMGDQKGEGPQSVMTSVLWNMEPTVTAVLKQVQDGTFKEANLAEYSFLKNGGSSLAPFNTGVSGGIPSDLIQKIQAKEQAMKSGAFVTPVNEKTPAGSVTAKG